MSGIESTSDVTGRGKIRLDKWLWHARFFKTRTLAAKQVSSGKVRVNGTKVAKPSVQVGPGDTLTFAQSRDIRVIELTGCGLRRGPASEAQGLYIDRAPLPETPADAPEKNLPPKAALVIPKSDRAKGDRAKPDLAKSDRAISDLAKSTGPKSTGPKPVGLKSDRKGRPTKKDRRQLDKSRNHPVE